MPDETPMTVDPEMSPPPKPADLPDFKKPPVSEVVLSLQFASISTFRSIHVGLLWQRFRREYPKVSEQAPLQATFETFGVVPANPGSFFQIEALLFRRPCRGIGLKNKTGMNFCKFSKIG